jgi:hypothetical protein
MTPNLAGALFLIAAFTGGAIFGACAVWWQQAWNTTRQNRHDQQALDLLEPVAQPFRLYAWADKETLPPDLADIAPGLYQRLTDPRKDWQP